VRKAVDDWLAGAGDAGCEVLADDTRRLVARVVDAGGSPWLVKQFRVASGRHRLRERLRGWVGQAQADREHRALRALRGTGAPVPALAARGVLKSGDPILVLEFIASTPLIEALDTPRAARRRLLRALGRRVAEFHAAGWVHGDLHFGNIVVRDGEPWLIDLQRARPSTEFRDRARDLGILDSSLEPTLSTADRTRLLDATFARLAPPGDEEAARAAVREASRAWTCRHSRSRARRSLRGDDSASPFETDSLRGLRVPGMSDEKLVELLRAHDRILLAGGGTESDGDLLDDGEERFVTRVRVGEERYVVKEVRCQGPLRATWERLSGSAAQRAWAAAHGLAALGVACPAPFAYADERRGRGTGRSLFVMEDLSAGVGADEPGPLSAEERTRSLLRLLVRLHESGVHHRDLKAGNIRILRPDDLPAAAPPRAALLDLEDVRFPRSLGEEHRLRALVQLNASLADDLVPADARRRAFDDYVTRLPFEQSREGVLARVVSESRARRHRWSGSECGG